MTRILKNQFQKNLQTKMTIVEDNFKLEMVQNLSIYINIHFYILEELSRYYINKLYHDISNLYIEISYIRFEIVVNHNNRFSMEYLQQTLEKLIFQIIVKLISTNIVVVEVMIKFQTYLLFFRSFFN